MSSGMRLFRPLAMSLTFLKVFDVIRRDVYAEKAPAGPTPPIIIVIINIIIMKRKWGESYTYLLKVMYCVCLILS